MTHNDYVFGLHAVDTLLSTNPERILNLCVLKERHDKKVDAILALAKNNHISVNFVARKELDLMCEHANHQGVIALCHPAEIYSEADIPKLLTNLTKPAFILILDSVQDPHNLGACFRTAEAAGVNFIIVPKDKSVGLTPTVRKVASGASELIPLVQVTNLARAISLLKENGVWIYGAAAEAEQNLYTCKLQGPLAIVMGAEGAGLRRLTRDSCDVLLNIPMQGKTSSLNVSVATGIFLFEVLRQAQKKT